MGTRSNIVYENDSGVYQYKYAHWDGYIDFMGRVLLTSFKNEEDIKKLFSIKTYISSIITLEREEERKTQELVNDKKLKYYNKRLEETDNHIINDCLVKYSKENNDEFSCVFTEKKEIFDNCCEDYVYLFDQSKKWKVCVRSNMSEKFCDLSILIEVNNFYNSFKDLDKLLEKENQSENLLNVMRDKSFTFMNFYNSQSEINQNHIFKELSNRSDSNFINKIQMFSKEKEAMLLESELNNKLIEKSSGKKLKI